jgi:uncharacterized membrane protein YkgB
MILIIICIIVLLVIVITNITIISGLIWFTSLSTLHFKGHNKDALVHFIQSVSWDLTWVSAGYFNPKDLNNVAQSTSIISPNHDAIWANTF